MLIESAKKNRLLLFTLMIGRYALTDTLKRFCRKYNLLNLGMPKRNYRVVAEKTVEILVKPKGNSRRKYKSMGMYTVDGLCRSEG